MRYIINNEDLATEKKKFRLSSEYTYKNIQ